LEFGARSQSFHEPVYSIRLVTGRLIFIIELELRHLPPILTADWADFTAFLDAD
jgi:hypothetical protein